MSEEYNINADFDYYVKNQSDFVSKYNGKYIIIVNQEIVKAFDTLDETVDYAKKNLKLGHFFMHQVGSGEDNYTTTISRISTHA